MSSYSLRGLRWFEALSGGTEPLPGLPASVKAADARLGGQTVRLLAVVADPDNRFPRALNGEVGLLEGWGLAKAVDQAIRDAGLEPQVKPVRMKPRLEGDGSLALRSGRIAVILVNQLGVVQTQECLRGRPEIEGIEAALRDADIPRDHEKAFRALRRGNPVHRGSRATGGSLQGS